MDTSKIVGEKIKSLRESQSISIEQLAERSGLAVEQIERIAAEHHTSFNHVVVRMIEACLAEDNPSSQEAP